VRNQAPGFNGCAPEENAESDALRRAFDRASAWRTPPHWSRCDWLDEVRAIIEFGATRAVLSYDKERGVPIRAHIYMRAVAAVWTRYRQEWAYYLHCVGKPERCVEMTVTPFDRGNMDGTIHHILEEALTRLSTEDQLLIRRLFWERADQRRVAAALQISQQCVSKRKARVLQLLHRALKRRSHLFSHFLTVCWAILDALDLLPVVDLL